MNVFEWLTDHFVEVLIIGVCLMFLGLAAERSAEHYQDQTMIPVVTTEEAVSLVPERSGLW